MPQVSACGLAFTLVALLAGGCDTAANQPAVPSYDDFTGRLVQLSADQDGDGRLDQWTYLDGNRPYRGEADTNGDGRIDRWEYFDERAGLLMVGSSSGDDGIEDTWTWVAPVDGESRVWRSRRRDRFFDRREYYKAAELTRAEEDTDGDGEIDRWDRYENNVLREAAFDTTLDRGKPNRRLLYDVDGQFVALEADADLDGRFERMKESR